MNLSRGLQTFLFAFFIILLPIQSAIGADFQPINADVQFEYAEFLFNAGNYDAAVVEYQRFAYFFPDDQRQRRSLFRIGESYFKLGTLQKALNQFQSLTNTDPLDQVATDSFFKSIDCHIQMRQNGQALIVLHNLIALTKSAAVRDQAYYAMGWIRIEQLEWQEARQAFDNLSIPGKKNHHIEELTTAIDASSSIKHKIPGLAGSLSVIPGMGQLYCGRYEDALIAFMVNIGLFWASYESYDHDLNVLGTLLAVVGTGFYASNIYSAVSSAQKYNRDGQYRHVEQMKDDLMKLSFDASSHIQSLGPTIALKFTF